MKNLKLVMLFLLSVLLNACNENTITEFEPSLEEDEYVLINFDGLERVYLSDEFFNITVNENAQGEEELNISLWPEEGTYTHFMYDVINPSVGEYTTEQLSFNLLDYSLNNEFEMIYTSCTSYSCDGEMAATIHQWGEVGDKIIGEFSGTLVSPNDETVTNTFTGEFIVYRDE